MTTLPSAAAQLESFMRPVLDALTAPGLWLIDFMPLLLLAGALPLAAGALVLVARR